MFSFYPADDLSSIRLTNLGHCKASTIILITVRINMSFSLNDRLLVWAINYEKLVGPRFLKCCPSTKEIQSTVG